MNKTDLIRSISDSTGIKLTEATRLVDAVFDTIAANLRRNEQVAISGFVYGQGDLSTPGKKGRPALVRRGKRLKFVNRDARDTIYHTVTACKAPCTRETGIAYPLADGPVEFDSGELGFGPAGMTAAANRVAWKTPKGLKPGTYTYFCRVHPFMRGAFKVAKNAKR